MLVSTILNAYLWLAGGAIIAALFMRDRPYRRKARYALMVVAVWPAIVAIAVVMELFLWLVPKHRERAEP